MLWSKPPVIRDDYYYYDGDKGGHADHRRPYAMMRTGAGDDVAHSIFDLVQNSLRGVHDLTQNVVQGTEKMLVGDSQSRTSQQQNPPPQQISATPAAVAPPVHETSLVLHEHKSPVTAVIPHQTPTLILSPHAHRGIISDIHLLHHKDRSEYPENHYSSSSGTSGILPPTWISINIIDI